MKHRPQKALSQNFLTDILVIEKFIEQAHIQPGESVIEIGPGLGAITQPLLKLGAKVIAIELDPTLAQKLSHANLTVITADALTFDYTQLPLNKIVSNLPFQIATPLLMRLIQFPFKSLTVIVQKEVAMRLSAQKNTKAYSALTIAFQNFCAARMLFTIPASAFHPTPKVTCAALQLHPHPPVHDLDLDFVFTAFRQRRKMLKNSLQKTYPGIKAAMQELELDLNARPENLSLEDFYRLYKKLFA